MNRLFKIILTMLLIFILAGCSNNYQNPIVTMEIENYGSIKIKLYP